VVVVVVVGDEVVEVVDGLAVVVVVVVVDVAVPANAVAGTGPTRRIGSTGTRPPRNAPIAKNTRPTPNATETANTVTARATRTKTVRLMLIEVEGWSRDGADSCAPPRVWPLCERVW
jgi:hypothetical protein